MQPSCEVNEDFPPTLLLSSSLITGRDVWKSGKNAPVEYMINNF
jgi:hypothetical protein